MTYTDYTIKVFGTSGNVLSISAEESFNLRLKNPCIDSAFFSLSSVALPVGETYTLFTTRHSFTHAEFQSVTNMTTSGLCGPVSYEAHFESVKIDSDSSPMDYGMAGRIFGIFSESLDLVGTRSFTV